MQHHQKLTKTEITTKKIAVFASGAGTNAKKIITFFHNHESIIVRLIVCNKKGAGVIDVANANGVEVLMIAREKFLNEGYVDQLQLFEIDFIVLAGFLWKIPQILIDHFRNKIINIHPSLLPKYGGKGMYGLKVHEAVIAAGETKSGITIHYVDEHYDNGDIIFQAECDVLKDDTADTLAFRVHSLEHEFFPKVIEKCVSAL
jgi:phosphoribosylglycinamide formyltransferase-1